MTMHTAAMWPQEARPKLMVLGDLLLDRYVWGVAERISPEAPVIVLKQGRSDDRPGGAANVATILSGFGADVRIAGVVGDDAEGSRLKELLNAQNVDHSGVDCDQSRVTSLKQRFIGQNDSRQPHHLLRVDREVREPIDSARSRALAGLIEARVSECDGLVISDYSKGVCTAEVLRLGIQKARSVGCPVLVDPGREADWENYRGATAVIPNRSAAERWIGRALRRESEILAVADQIRTELQLEAAVITLDRDGIAVSDDNGGQVLPCRPRDVCDVTGAGDTVISTLAMCLTSGLSLTQATVIANAAAGLQCERFGATTVARQDIENELCRLRPARDKLGSLEQVARRVLEHRRQGRSVIFTNGCFDLLHAGHVQMLQEAAALGDVLIVAINSDAGVRRLKGPERPVICERDRARMLCSLECVDHVVVFDEDTPHRFLEQLRPDVLVKGGTSSTVVGREIVEAYGGRAVRLGAVEAHSTTRIIARMRNDKPTTFLAEVT